jgi:valyl-tRNA synthetase
LINVVELFIPLEGIIDTHKEAANIKDKINEVRTFLKGIETKLKNKDFVKKAPKDIVEKEKNRLIELKDSVKKLNTMLKELQK